jgi:hypothetical protein
MLASRCRNQLPRTSRGGAPAQTPVLCVPPPCKLLLGPSDSCMDGGQPVELATEILRRCNADRDTCIVYRAREPCMSVGVNTTHLISNVAAVWSCLLHTPWTHHLRGERSLVVRVGPLARRRDEQLSCSCVCSLLPRTLPHSEKHQQARGGDEQRRASRVCASLRKPTRRIGGYAWVYGEARRALLRHLWSQEG